MRAGLRAADACVEGEGLCARLGQHGAVSFFGHEPIGPAENGFQTSTRCNEAKGVL